MLRRADATTLRLCLKCLGERRRLRLVNLGSALSVVTVGPCGGHLGLSQSPTAQATRLVKHFVSDGEAIFCQILEGIVSGSQDKSREDIREDIREDSTPYHTVFRSINLF